MDNGTALFGTGAAATNRTHLLVTASESPTHWLVRRSAAGQPAEIVTDGTRAAVFVNGTLVRDLTIDNTHACQPSGRRRGPKRN